jgi:4-aminobutyrate aminotransferase/(S)-3-amino-2-methylpropionate transaminase
MLSEPGLEGSSGFLSRREDAVARGVGVASDRFVDRAEGSEVWDVEGRRYIDFAAGIAVLNTGHRHPRVMAAVHEQLDRFTHTCFQVVPYEGYVHLAERLNAMAPIAEPAKSILLTTGVEAVENALKIARYATKRRGIISFSGSFHGRTLIGMALTGKVTPYKVGFGPLPGDIYHLPFPDDGSADAVARSAEALDHLFATTISPTDVAAIIVEPVQGEGGCHVAPAELLRILRSTCDRHGILLIDDEIQAGMGRTGSMFAIEPSGVKADIVTVAKGLAGGFPLAGVIARADVMDAVPPGGLGGTFAGSPISCAAALAVLDVIEDEGLVARAAAIGKRLSERIRLFHSRNDILPISLPRGRGAMLAFDVLAERGGTTGDPALAKLVTRTALENGLIVLTCDKSGQAIRMLPPLNASDQIIDEGLDRLEQSLLQVTT